MKTTKILEAVLGLTGIASTLAGLVIMLQSTRETVGLSLIGLYLMFLGLLSFLFLTYKNK